VLLARTQGNKSISYEMDSRFRNEADIFTKNLDGPLSNTMQSYFLAKEQLVVRGVTINKGGV
jgi:hypothetical protein